MREPSELNEVLGEDCPKGAPVTGVRKEAARIEQAVDSGVVLSGGPCSCCGHSYVSPLVVLQNPRD